MSDPFEKALQRALRHETPGEDFADRVAARLPPTAISSTAGRLDSMSRRPLRSRWLPAALAAGVIAGFGLLQWRQHALETARANQARAQLLQALSIASDNINIVRSALARAENPHS